MIRLDAFLDIETEDWDRFALAAVKYEGGDVLMFDDEDDFWPEVVRRGGHVWTWNGGKYDTLAFADWADRHELPYTADRAGSRVTRLACGPLVLHDAKALIPMRLERAAELVGGKKLDFPYELIRAPARRMPTRLRRKLEEYLLRDVELGFDIMAWVISWATLHGFELKNTIGGSSWASAQKQLDLPAARWEMSSFYRFASKAKFGGRVQILRPAAEKGFRDDINSAYPAALQRTPLPVGDPVIVDGAKAARCFAMGLDGIYSARAYVPRDEFLPPLPVHLPKRVAYPVGYLRGHWTGLELRAAELTGIRIERFGTSLVYPDSEPLLRPFVEKVWKVRSQAGKKTAEGELCKWFANSLTGKLGQGPEAFQVVCRPDPERVIACPGTGPCTGACRGGKAPPCRRWLRVNPALDIWKRPIWRLSDCAHVHWSDHLLAATRVEWREHALADGKNGRTLVAGDTDSNFTTEPRTHRLGAELGEWDREGTFENWLALGPKAYRYRDPERDRWVVRLKGVPERTLEAFARFAAGDPVTVERGVYSLLIAAKKGKGLFRKGSLTRQSHHDGVHYGDRLLRSDGLTYPQTWQELIKL